MRKHLQNAADSRGRCYEYSELLTFTINHEADETLAKLGFPHPSRNTAGVGWLLKSIAAVARLNTNLAKELEANCLNAKHHVFPVNRSHVNESIGYALYHSSCSIQVE